MSRVVWIGLALSSLVLALEIPIDEVKTKSFKKSITVNSQVVQFENAKENITSQLAGKVTNYFVKVGQKVKKGQKIATIESIELSDLSSTLMVLKSELVPIEDNYNMTQKLYEIGVESLQTLNALKIQRNTLRSKVSALKAKLKFLGVKNGKIRRTLTLYTQSSGRVSDILVSLNSMVNTQSILVKISQKKGLMLKSFVPLKYAQEVAIGNKITILLGEKKVYGHISQILSELDKSTQQIQILSTIEASSHRFFVHAFLKSEIALNETLKQLVIKKSALSFFNNEWVVFVPKEEEHHEEDEHEGHDETHENHDEHTKHEGHDEHEEEEVPFEAKSINVLSKKGKWVAIEGLEEYEKYVSDKSYYVKSLLLKSAMGGHGH